MQPQSFEAGKRDGKMQTKRAGIFVAQRGFWQTLYPCGFGGGGKKVGHILKKVGHISNFLGHIFSLLRYLLLHTPEERHKNVLKIRSVFHAPENEYSQLTCVREIPPCALKPPHNNAVRTACGANCSRAAARTLKIQASVVQHIRQSGTLYAHVLFIFG